MYYNARPPQKPWRVARNYSNFKADKMTSERPAIWYKAMGIKMRPGNDMAMRREQRKQQRRLNKYLCDPNTSEWDYNGSDKTQQTD
jgi:hypothetical protein